MTREPFGEWIVLQRRRLEGLRIVLQYTNCIVTEAARAGQKFVPQYTDCIVTER